MIHTCRDDSPPIGRPPIVRDAALAKLRELKRARVERICEETGLKHRSVLSALNTAFKADEVLRHHIKGDGYGYLVYEVRDE